MEYPELPENWGTTGLTSTKGHLERPYPTSKWRLPFSIELHGDDLIYDIFGPAERLRETWKSAREAKQGIGLLAEFTTLADKPSSRILTYARRWGVLGICAHDLPDSHYENCRPMGWPGPCHEPIEAWRHFARQARAMLSIAAALHAERRPEVMDWATVYETSQRMKEMWLEDSSDISIDLQRHVLTVVLDEWLGLGNVEARVELQDTKELRLVLDGHGLFGNLALQLSLAASRSRGWSVCVSCGMPYPKERRPQSGRRNYCEGCGKKAADKDASRAYRNRKAEAKTLYGQGLSLEEIANRLGSDPDKIRRWVANDTQGGMAR